KVISMETVPAPGHIVGTLAIERGTAVTRLVRLKLRDAAPLAVVVNYMRPGLGQRIRPRDLTRVSLLEFLRDRLGIRLGVIRQSLEARLPDVETARLLRTDLSQPMEPEDLRWADDEIAPAIHWDRLKVLTLEHLGGTAPRHDIAVFNRLTGATLATHLTLVKPGDAVIGVSVSRSHPSVLRAAAHV